MRAFAGLDVGTSGGRCVIVAEDGSLLASTRRTWGTHLDRFGFPTFDPGVTIASLADALAEAVALAGVTIEAIGVTSQRSGVVLCDEHGSPVLASPNADPRGMVEGLALERAHGETAYQIAGRLPVMLYLPARLAWLRANDPDAAARVAMALSLGDWVIHALTGARSTDRSQAAETLVYDVGADSYSDDLLERFSVPRDILPTVRASGAVAGEVRADGFPTGVAVACGGGDTQAALLGASVVDPGGAAVVAGTTMLCEIVTSKYGPDPQGALWCSPHVLDDLFVREAHCGEAGAAIRWFADLLEMDAERVAALAQTGEPGAGGVMFVDPLPSTATNFTLVRRGAFSFPVPLLALGRGRADVARALFEGIAFGACAGIELLGERTSLTVTGGVARSSAFIEAVAGALETTVLVPEDPASSSARGAAIAAAATHHGGTSLAAAAMRAPLREVAPQGRGHYAGLYRQFRTIADEMKAFTTRIEDLNL